MEEAVKFKFLVRLILVHVFCPRKYKACCYVFVFLKGMSNVISDLVLYLLQSLNISIGLE